MTTDPRIGTEIAGHRILSVIGRGGMSVVYLAEHLSLGRKVALKVLGPELAEDEAFRERFIRESRVAAGLDHPNVVTVYDAGEAGDVLYLSMRYVAGTDLERLLRAETRLDPARAVRIVTQSAAALDAAHAAGLVHRDVKPGNILLTSDARTSTDRAYLSDFGVTKRLHSGAGITRTGQFVGTVDYVAPEQIQSDDVDGRADEYALGCVLFRCITGEVPFPRDTEVATIYAHLQDPAPVPSDVVSGLPAALDGPIARALAKSRDERFETCRGFADAAASAIRPLVSERRAVAVPEVAAPPPRRPGARRTGWLVAGAAALAAGVAVVALLLLPDGGSSTPSPSPPAPIPTLAWSLASDPAGVLAGPLDQQAITALQAGSSVVVAGQNQKSDGADAAVWTSADGQTWDARPGEGFQGTGQRRIDDMAFRDGVLIAVGWARAGGYSDPAVWRSQDDGASWQRVSSDRSGLHQIGSQGEMHAIVATPDGLVAAGDQRSRGSMDAAVWTSATGGHWDPVSAPSFVGPTDQEILGLSGFHDHVVAVGFVTSQAGDRDAAVWISSGGDWSRASGDGMTGPGDQEIDAVVAGGPGLVAVGSDSSGGDADAAVWTSSDGATWRRVPTGDALGGPGDQAMSAVTRLANDALVAGGAAAGATGDADAAVWLSGDGIHWRREPSQPTLSGAGSQSIDALLLLRDGRLLAAGSRGGPNDRQAGVWLATVTFPSPSD